MAKKKKINQSQYGGKILGRVDEKGNKIAFIQNPTDEEDIAPVKQTNNTWFKKGTLDDSGYAIENPIDAINRINAGILMTGVDALGQFGKGFLGSAEGVTDLAKTTTADVLDFFGADNKAKKLRESAERTWGVNEQLEQALASDNGTGIDDMSFLGEKGKTVPQVLGTTMFSMTTGGLGGALLGTTAGASATSMALLGMSAAGNSEQEAIKEMKANQKINGLSDKEIYKNAKLYGVLSGIIETGTEMMFGAAAQGSQLLGIGTGAFDEADDAVINALTKKISNKMIKTFAQAGLKATSEGVEEVASGFLNAWAKKLTYMKQEDIKKLIEDENLLDSFLSGTFSAVLSQAPSVVNNITTTENGKLRLRNNNEIRDFLTNLNEQEQQVVEREIENRLGQEENVTKKRRSEIEKQVIEDLDRGYINANTIRDVLGENYNAERDVRLNESFNEETRRTQAYENDLSKYDEKQRKTIQTAIDSGLLNNSNKTHDFVDLIAKLSADKGIDFDFTNNERIKDTGFAVEGKTVNGFIKDGKVTLNLESNQALNKTVGHEITHVLEGTELYNSLQDSLKSFVGEREWNNRISELEKTYKGVKGANIENELTSDLVGEYVFNDESFVKSLSTRNPNLFQKIFDEIKYMVKIATAGSKEARDLEKVKRAFEKAYRETSKEQKGTQYSIKESKKALENQFKELTGDSMLVADAKLGNYAFQQMQGREVEAPYSKEAMDLYEKIQDSKQTSSHLYHSTPVDRIQSIVQNGLQVGSEQNQEGVSSTDKLYLSATEELADSFTPNDSVTLRISPNANLENLDNDLLGGEGSYTITNNIDPKYLQVKENGKWVNLLKSQYAKQDVKYSLTTDNQGRQLSEQQQEFFKDSKARDEDGRLLELYHGSKARDVNIFEYSPERQTGTDYGEAYYFTSDYNKAKGYQYDANLDERVANHEAEHQRRMDKLREANFSEEARKEFLEWSEQNKIQDILNDEDYIIENVDNIGGETKKVYLNLTNPLIVDANGEYYYNVYPSYFEEAREKGNDGIIVKNVIDNPRGEARPIDTYIAFKNNQFKNVDNTNPTSNPDIRYSLSDDAETFKTPYGVEVVKNPSTDDYIQMRQDILEEYPWLRGEKILRQTYDEEGNVYYWNAYDAQHADVEPYINKKYNTRTFQNDGWWKNPIYKDSPKDYSYVDTSNFKYSLSEAPKQDNQGRELTKNQQEFYKNVSPEVRDENGNLMSFYHGSNSEFTIFDITKSGESSKEAKVGFWFTPNKKGAENFANEVWYGDKTPTTYEVYLNIKNPKVYETYEVDQQQRDNMIQNRKNIEQEIRESSHKYSWTETGDYKVTSLYNDLVEMNRREKNGIRFKEDAQYNEKFYRKLAEERNISNEKFDEMNQDAKNQVELETQKRIADDEFYSYVYSDAYEQFKTDLYLSAGMRAEDANVGGMGMMMKNENEAVANFVEGLKQEGYDGIVIKNTHYDNESLGEGKNNNQYVAFYPNQIKNVTNENPTDNVDIRYQLGNNEVAPTSGWNVRSEDVRLQSAFKDTIAPLQEQVQQLTDTITRLEDRIAPIKEEREDIETRSEGFVIDKINDLLWRLQGKKDRYFGLTKPDMDLLRNTVLEDRQNRTEYLNDFINNLTQKIVDNSNADVNVNEIKEELSSNINDYLNEYRALNEQEADELYQETQRGFENEVAPIRENLTPEENQRMDMLELLERNGMLTDERRYEKEQLENKINPVYPTDEATPGQALSDIRDIDEVGKRDVKAYQYEHPEVKPYFQEEARGMLNDLNNSIKGERFINESQERGQGTSYDVLGVKRFTSPEIAELLDSKYGYTYDDIRKGLNAIIEDHGAENIAIAKRIELVLDDNLRNGYTDWQTGMEVPPNQQYLNMLAEQEWQNYFDDINSQYPLEQLQEPQYALDEETDFSDVSIEPDLSNFTADDIDVSPFLEGLQGASERQAERQQLREELNQKREVKIPKQSDGKRALNRGLGLLVNEFAVLDDYSKQTGNKDIKFKTDTYNNYQAIAQSNIETAQTDINGKAIGRSGNSIFEEAKNLGLENTFDEYLKQWANVDRAKQGKGAANYSAKESYKIVKEMEAKHPALKRLGKDMWQYYRNARHNLRDAGIISQDVSDMLGRMYPHYTPYISENIENYFTDEGKLKPKATIKRAKGGAAIGSLLSAEEAMQRYTKSEFNTIFGNDLFREIVNTSNDIVQLGGDDRGMQFVNADNLYADKDGYYLTAYENGEPITARISEDMYRTLTRESRNRISDIENTFSAVTKPLQAASKLRRNILTSWSPTFIAKNFIKDFQEGIFNSKYTKDFIKNYPTAFKELATNTELAQQFKSLYGSGLTMGQYDIDANNYNPSGKNKNFLKGIKNVNELIELAPRYAEFKASIDHGASIQEAMYNAREVTTNFSRGGTLAKALNRNGFTFLNSSIQGFDKFIRNFSGENGAKGIVNSLAKAAIFGIAPAVFNELAFGSGDDKDEEYEALPDYIKDNYYIIKVGDGNFIRIPKGRVLSVFGSAARRTIEAMEGEENAFEGYWNNVQQQIGINNPEENNIFAPLIQAMGGRKLDSGQTAGSAWYGGDIIPSRLQKERPEDQYDASIDKLSIWLGQHTGISPYKINYVLDQYTGGMGDIFLPTITPEANSDGSIIAPIKDQFTADTVTDNKYVSEFYDTYNKIYTGSKKTDEDILKKNYMSNISYQMSDLYKERREIQSDTTLSKKEKYEKAQAIKAEINRLAKEGLDNYENISITGDYAEINGQEYQKTDDGWKKLSSNTSDEVNSLGLTNREKNNYIKTQKDISNIKKKYKDTDDYVGKKQDIIGDIINTNLNDEAKMSLYQDTYKDKFSNYATDLGFDADTYLEYKAQDFSADKDRNGKSISGSKKRKVFDYINSMDVPYEQKLILAKSEYNSFNDNNYEIIEYIENTGMDYDERIELYKALGFKVDGDSISW